jgi:hypothetical protein
MEGEEEDKREAEQADARVAGGQLVPSRSRPSSNLTERPPGQILEPVGRRS